MKFTIKIVISSILLASSCVCAERKFSPEDFIKTARKQMSMKEYKDALETLNNAQSQYPNQEEILANLALVYLCSKDYKTSIKYYEKVIKNNPDHFEVLLGIAVCKIMMGDLIVGWNMLRKIDKKYPDNLETIRYYRMIAFIRDYKEKYGKLPDQYQSSNLEKK